MTMRFDVKQEKWITVREEYRNYQISIATNHCGEKADIMVFDLRKAEGAQNVTQEFKCFRGGEISGTFENIRAIMDEIDKREDKNSVEMKYLNSIPPDSNPYHYDMTRMGVCAGKFEVMYMGEHPLLTNEIVVVHLPTGKRVALNFTK